MNREYELDRDGNVIDRSTFKDVMAAIGKQPYKKPEPMQYQQDPCYKKKGVLFVDIVNDNCYNCPCCDNEQAYCTALENSPECVYKERLPECPIKEITITPEIFAERMKNIQELYSDRYDTEERHKAMDDLMCELLRELGYGEGIDIFEETSKWYA